MDIATLLHSLTTQGLSLKLGEADTLAVLGPVASLTLEQQRSLAEHKLTLLSMLKPPPPTCYIPDCGEAEEREAIQFADSSSPEVMAALIRSMEYFERLADAVGRHWPERLEQILLEPEPQQSPCRRCGESQTYLAIIHAGESLRRDCAKCGRFIDFPSWHNRQETAKILADVAGSSRYDKEASCPSAGNTQASSDDNLSYSKETANG